MEAGNTCVLALYAIVCGINIGPAISEDVLWESLRTSWNLVSSWNQPNFIKPDTLPHDHGASYELKDSCLGKVTTCSSIPHQMPYKCTLKFELSPKECIDSGCNS